MQNQAKREQFTIPIGPQHPALKEPGHFLFTVEGEIVTDAVVRLGYAHRGIEKATEQRNWIQNLYLLERICGICSHIHATAYSLGVRAACRCGSPPQGAGNPGFGCRAGTRPQPLAVAGCCRARSWF